MIYGNYGWGWMALMPLLWAVLIGVVVWATVRLAQTDRSGGPATTTQGETARELLDRRLVSGEIDGETYRQMRDQLADREPHSSS